MTAHGEDTPEPDPAPDTLGSRASKLVGQAASRLSDEVGAADADQVVERLRDDVHRAVDAVVDLVGGAVTALSGGAGGDLRSAQQPGIYPSPPAGAGTEATARVELTNDSDAATEPFELNPTDLASPEGERIPAAAVKVADVTRVIAGGSSDAVEVTVQVPAETRPGVYTGELKASGAEICAPVVIEVV